MISFVFTWWITNEFEKLKEKIVRQNYICSKEAVSLPVASYKNSVLQFSYNDNNNK